MLFKRLEKWILQLKPGMAFLFLFIFLLPFMAIWLYIIGMHTSTKLKRNNKVFQVVIGIFIITSFTICLLGIGLQIKYHGHLNYTHQNLFSYLPGFFFASWLITNGFVSKYMVDYENSQTEEYKPLPTKTKEYIGRFFQLTYLLFAIFWLQPIINKYPLE
jgi:hypothetical protein